MSETEPGTQYIICVSCYEKQGRYVFCFQGKYYSALVISPDLDDVLSMTQADQLIAQVTFVLGKSFKQLTSRDNHQFVCWIKHQEK